jgi:hypothetical protein
MNEQNKPSIKDASASGPPASLCEALRAGQGAFSSPSAQPSHVAGIPVRWRPVEPASVAEKECDPYPQLPDANQMRKLLYRIGKTIMEHEAINEPINWKLIRLEIDRLLYPIKPPVRIL